MKLIVVVLVVCVTVGLSSAWFWSKKEVDFEALNKHLLAKLANNEAREENLALIKADMDSLKPRVQKAAEIILRLASVNSTAPCTEELLLALSLASEAGMSSKDDQKAKKRVERLIRAELILAMDTCRGYVEETFPRLLEKTDSKLLQFNDKISPNNVALHRSYWWPGSTHMADILEELAQGDPKTMQNGLTRKSLIFEEREVFNYAYKTYMVEPCKKLSDTFGSLLRGATAIYKLRGGKLEFKEARFFNLRRMARTIGVCKSIIRRADDDEDTFPMFASRW